MLSRGLVSIGRQAQPARGFATEQALRERIASVKNIQKITSAMKMVAVCKLRVAQDGLATARNYARSVEDVNFAPADTSAPTKSQLWLAISSDRGLCGAINSSISRGTRDSILRAQADGLEPDDTKIMLVGEKCKQGLERLFKQNFEVTISETAKFKPCTFKQCCEITDFWSKIETERTSLFYQKFVSMIAYDTTEATFWSYDAVKDDLATEMAAFEMEGDADILQNFQEFSNAIKLNLYFSENETSTLSARMTAMDNSSSNATDMVDNLQLILNRSRQARITTELSEIIAGAAASDDQK